MSSESLSRQQFWKAIKIWIKNSHVVNRRLSGVSQMLHSKLFTSIVDITKNCEQLKYQTMATCEIKNVFASMYPIKENIIYLKETEFDKEFCEIIEKDSNDQSLIYFIVQKLLPRNCKYREAFRIILLDPNNNSATFISISEENDKLILSPNYPYSLVFASNRIQLQIPTKVLDDDPSAKWLNEKLLPRILKWASSDVVNNNGITDGSIILVSREEYNDLYQKLKIKYGVEIVKVWPESTDPSKFVFEDVAIATYLLLLWKDERLKSGNTNMQSFIDLGCGNGLLVYILSSEGHPGRGVDVRKRGIWDMYPNFVKLEVEPVTPSKECLYEGTDWIIGNHSDELTPWVPVIAARSSYNCRFFLLPCCAYEFDGKKYQRHDSSKSQYNEYLDYVKLICEKCGIHTEIDRLKIPSTKRICLVGSYRSYLEEEFKDQLKELHKFVEERCKSQCSTIIDNNCISDQNDHWASNFKPREALEKHENILNNNWNSGGCLPLHDIVKLVSTEQLKSLKSECGGLQTLLRNHHHIFEIISGNVKLRYPRTKSEALEKIASSNKKRKSNNNKSILTQKPCWFFQNHPNGCPLTENDCSFLHV
ncbi:putative tRNA (uracil-O(2)-)-methyltransferase isoform X2 [Arctopsyche grandis]|uniref:putative tRNA (uracil-O(2)-)-methyltransferase isoform X2 n=1 Tax=Arctopsyche grandis TaxID=121162 RepID=UPI00406D8C38